MIYVGGEMISAGELSLLSSPFHKIKFGFSKKTTKIDEIFTVDLTLTIHNVKWTVCQFLWPS